MKACTTFGYGGSVVKWWGSGVVGNDWVAWTVAWMGGVDGRRWSLAYLPKMFDHGAVLLESVVVVGHLQGIAIS